MYNTIITTATANLRTMTTNMETTIVTGIICKECKVELPPMMMSEHLDIHNPKNKMCECHFDKKNLKLNFEIITNFERLQEEVKNMKWWVNDVIQENGFTDDVERREDLLDVIDTMLNEFR
jgi:hypothetical protein